jgi:hypothetical protein
MAEYADLEIGLHRRDPGSYAIDFRFSQPKSETDIRLGQEKRIQVAIDLDELNRLSHDPQAYSQALTQAFFSAPDLQTAFAQARTSAESLDSILRFKLTIGQSAAELQNLYWELLCDPQDLTPLSTSETILFSRYLSSIDWRPVHLRSQKELSALVLVANPTNLADYNLAPVDTPAELARARASLGEIQICTLPEQDGSRRATIDNWMQELRENEYDIVYLVCHGSLVKEEAWLWLEDNQALAARISADEVVSRMKELENCPRLIILASCQSASSRTGDALSALGPRLAEARVPAVLAMQDSIEMDTIAAFMPVFFRELQRDGQIDRALAVARGVVRHRADYWVPVLFTRMKSGRLWYTPGFGDEEEDYEKWTSIVGFIKEKTCTPIIGPGLLDALLGSRRDIAVRWAEKSGFPLAPQDRDVLPRVAQYLVTHQSPGYLPIALIEAVRDAILRRYPNAIPDELKSVTSWTTPQMVQALQLAMRQYMANNPNNPYKLLADLRLPIYITTGAFDFLTDALIAAGAQPVVRVCPGNKFVPRDKSIYEDTPTPEKPLVYHLFGHISLPKSQIYSEDQFFDYLISVTLNKSLIPSAVRAALTNSSLLFLGFQLDDWEFRVFFRYLMAQEGREMLTYYSHVSAQMEPEEDRILDVKRAHRYLEQYFESEHIGIYWGNTEEFLSALWQHLKS